MPYLIKYIEPDSPYTVDEVPGRDWYESFTLSVNKQCNVTELGQASNLEEAEVVIQTNSFNHPGRTYFTENII